MLCSVIYPIIIFFSCLILIHSFDIQPHLRPLVPILKVVGKLLMVMIIVTSSSLLSAMEILQLLGMLMTNGKQGHAEILEGLVDL